MFIDMSRSLILMSSALYFSSGTSDGVGVAADSDKKRKSLGVAATGELKRKRDSIGGANAGGLDSDKAAGGLDVVEVGDSATSVFASSVLAGQALYEANCERLASLGVPGPPVFLQPLWPGFMTDMAIRSKVFVMFIHIHSII